MTTTRVPIRKNRGRKVPAIRLAEERGGLGSWGHDAHGWGDERRRQYVMGDKRSVTGVIQMPIVPTMVVFET